MRYEIEVDASRVDHDTRTREVSIDIFEVEEDQHRVLLNSVTGTIPHSDSIADLVADTVRNTIRY